MARDEAPAETLAMIATGVKMADMPMFSFGCKIKCPAFAVKLTAASVLPPPANGLGSS